MRTMLRYLAMVCCGLLPAVTKAGELPASFTLGKYTPADCFLYIHFVENPERAWLDEKWSKVWDAFHKSGIHEDVAGLIFGSMEAADRGKVEATIAEAKGLLARVRWEDLIRREFVFAERIAPPFPSYLLIVRGAEGSGDANSKGLAAILTYLIAMTNGKAEITAKNLDDVDVWSVTWKDEPFGIHLLRRGDVIALVAGTGILDEILGLMHATEQKPAMVNSPRFKEALAQVRSPEDGVVFVDLKALVDGADRLIAYGCQKKCTDGTVDPWLAVIRKIKGMCDVMDYGITTIETRGRQDWVDSVGRVQPGKEGLALARICNQRKAFDRFDKYIPVDAVSFSVDSFIDLELLYQTVVDFIEREIPDGAAAIAHWKRKLAEWEFDPHADLFSWWSGEMINVDMPAAMVTPMGGADSVLFIRVKNPTLAAAKIETGLGKLKALVGAELPLVIGPATGVRTEGFKEITYAPMAMFLRPVVGVTDEWLVIASSAGAVNKCLDVAAGKVPSVRENKRFVAEGIVPEGPVHAVSFSDTSNAAQEAAQVFSAIGMFGGIAVASIPEDPQNPESKEVKRVMRQILGIVGKLGPVVQTIDFYSSQSSVCTVDGLVTRTRQVTTYKGPAEKEKTAEATTVPPMPMPPVPPPAPR